jgi:hypothetical protein
LILIFFQLGWLFLTLLPYVPLHLLEHLKGHQLRKLSKRVLARKLRLIVPSGHLLTVTEIQASAP